MTSLAKIQNDDGVVLVEVLVAFAILMGVITMGFQIFSDGLSRSRQATARAARVVEAASLFSSLTDNFKPGTSTRPSSEQGRDFTLRVVEIRSNAPATSTRRPVFVQIFDGPEREGTLLFATVVLSGSNS